MPDVIWEVSKRSTTCVRRTAILKVGDALSESTKQKKLRLPKIVAGGVDS